MSRNSGGRPKNANVYANPVLKFER